MNPEQMPLALWISALLIFAGIAYKISAVPMHMWTPDVYEGSPTPVAALFSVGSKAAGFALLMRFFLVAFTRPLEAGHVVLPASEMSSLGFALVGAFNWPRFLLISAVFTMFAGNLAALSQVSVKRILAYSAIAHAGYMLMGASTQSSAGLTALIFYLMIYATMNMGAFWVVSKVEDTFGGDHLVHFRGLGSRRPFYAIVMGIFLFSLIGLPPFAGFLGKYYLFAAVIAREMYGLAVLGVLNTVISLYFYIKIAKAMFLEEPEVKMPAGKTPFDSVSTEVFLVLLAIPNVVLIFDWEPVIQIARKAVFLFVGATG
jgi:NADH-quinone oxidoreductase subunit N